MFVVSIVLLSLFVQIGSAQKPDQVLSLRQRVLSKETYMNVARQWIEYMEENGESVEGHLNAGQALRYAGEEKPVYLRHYQQAVSLDPDNVRALDLYGCHLRNKGTPEERTRGLEMLERAKDLDPTYGEILYSLYSAYCCEGRLEDASSIADDIYRRQIISVPLQDFGHNLIAGLPRNAVIITNGDNDTYPPIALQAGLNFRPDVTILNRSLLQCEEYVLALSRRYDWFPDPGNYTKTGPFGMAGSVIDHLLVTRERPIFAAITVAFGDQPRSVTIQGLAFRIDDFTKNDPNIDYHTTWELFQDEYRMDSSTYWGYPWELRNSERLLMKNYAIIAYYAAEEALKNDDSTAAEWFVRFGNTIAEFHNFEELISMFSQISFDD